MSKELATLESIMHEELKSIQEVSADCNAAVITYAIDKNNQMHKVVTLFTRTTLWSYEFEHYGVMHSKTLAENPNICISKTFDYSIKNNIFKQIGDSHKVLYRTLQGFSKDKCTQDLREEYENRY